MKTHQIRCYIAPAAVGTPAIVFYPLRSGPRVVWSTVEPASTSREAQKPRLR